MLDKVLKKPVNAVKNDRPTLEDIIDKINAINETSTLNSNLYNIIIKFKKMTGTTVEMLKSYLRFDPQYITNVHCNVSYRMFLWDNKATKTPVLEVNEWQTFGGFIQALTSGGQVLNTTEAVLPIKKVAFAFEAAEQEKKSFMIKTTPAPENAFDKYGDIDTVQLLQFGENPIPFVPYFAIFFTLTLQMIMFYYGCTDLHSAILKLTDFAELSLSNEERCDLLKNAIDRHKESNGFLKSMLESVDGDVDRLIGLWIELYWPLFSAFDKRFEYTMQLIEVIS